jgi:lipopolysaccharide/colanic/teichoic acid biosynthesis glycosyltransferase
MSIDLEVLPERLMSKEAANDDAVMIDQRAAEAETEPQTELGLDRPFWKIKRAMDFLIVLTIGILISPVALIVCAVVLFDVGIPVVFWQQRVGRNGVPLHLYKFRTLQTLFDRQTKEKRDAQLPSMIGRFLQRTRLDELPQLWNILSGDMSLIGPRPLLPIDQPVDYSTRLSVRPGLTGWAQVCGGKSITVEEKTALDEWYIRHATAWREVYIVLLTLKMLLLTGDRRDEAAIIAALRERSADHAKEAAKEAFERPDTSLTKDHGARLHLSEEPCPSQDDQPRNSAAHTLARGDVLSAK